MLRATRLICALLALLVAGACAQQAADDSGPKADPQEWAWLTEAKAKLDAQRAELRELVAQQSHDASDEEKAALAEQINAKESEVAAAAEELATRLVGYINALQIPQGEPLSPDQLAAMRMKTSEDMETAREWIEKGGDYIRAIDIYESQRAWDPDNPELAAALAKAQEMRFMTEERFAVVTKGMTRDEVRGALGQVHLRNIREDEEKGVISWLYRTEDGGAAGVFFKKGRDDKFVVYDSKFQYVRPQISGSESAEAAAPEQG